MASVCSALTFNGFESQPSFARYSETRFPPRPILALPGIQGKCVGTANNTSSKIAEQPCLGRATVVACQRAVFGPDTIFVYCVTTSIDRYWNSSR